MYSELQEPQRVLEMLSDVNVVAALPEQLAASYVHNSVKLLSHLATVEGRDLDVSVIRERLLLCLHTCASRGRGDVEIIERASQLEAILELFLSAFDAFKAAQPRPAPASQSSDGEWGSEPTETEQPDRSPAAILSNVFVGAYELNPVNAKAQSLVGLPEGLDLDAWIVPPSSSADDTERGGASSTKADDVDEYGRPRRTLVGRSAAQEEEVEEVPRRKKVKGKGKAKRGDEAVSRSYREHTVSFEAQRRTGTVRSSREQRRSIRSGGRHRLYSRRTARPFRPATSVQSHTRAKEGEQSAQTSEAEAADSTAYDCRCRGRASTGSSAAVYAPFPIAAALIRCSSRRHRDSRGSRYRGRTGRGEGGQAEEEGQGRIGEAKGQEDDSRC